jgi:amphi-Trp domain-containing protein
MRGIVTMAEKDVSVKERVGQAQFTETLRQILDGLEGNRNFTINIKDHTCEIPADVLSKAKLGVEYEKEEGKIELEIKIEWTEEEEEE